MSEVDKRLRLRCRTGTNDEVYGSPNAPTNPMRILHQTNGIIFPYTPTITYTQNPQWQSQELTHSIQQYYYFTAIESASISIAGTFTVQNQKEGEYLLAVWHFLRSYSKMNYGLSAGAKKGLPPPILLLDGYGDFVFYELPVLIKTWNMDFPNDVDYVRINSGALNSTTNRFSDITLNSGFQTPNPTSPNAGFRSIPGNTISADASGYAYLPSKTNIQLNLVVQRPPVALKRDFNLQEFREGRLLKGFT